MSRKTVAGAGLRIAVPGLKNKPVRVWQVLFGALIFLAVSYAISLNGQFKLDTGLADVAPKIANNAQTQNAIKALRDNIEKRIVLLVSGLDEDHVLDASDELARELQQLPAVFLLPSDDELLEQLIVALEPYRFGLLSEPQVKLLNHRSAQEWVDVAKRDATSISGARIYSFAKDPFGISSDSLFDVLQQLQVRGAEDSPLRPKGSLSHQSLALLIKSDALNMRQQQDLSVQLDTIIAKVLSQYEVSIDRSGIFFFAAQAAQQSKKDISLISSISTVGVVLLLLFVFRSLLALALPVVSVLMGVGFAFLVTHFVFGSVHVLTIVFGASLIGIVIDYSLHYFYHSASGLQATPELHKQEYSALHRALLLSLCTSLIGYAALSFSGLAALKKVALFSCCGLLMAWLSVICLGGVATRGGLRANSAALQATVHRLLALLRVCRRPFLGIVIVMTIMGGATSWLLVKPFSDDPRVFFTASPELLESERRVAALANDYEPGRYVLLLGDSVADIQQRFESLQTVLRTETDLPVRAFSSVFGLVPTAQQQAQAYELQTKLYQSGGALDSLATELGMAPAAVTDLRAEFRAASARKLSPEDIHEILGEALPPMWFASDAGYVGFVLIRKGVNADALDSALNKIDGVEYVNTLEKTKAALAEQRESASMVLLLAYLLVAVLLAFRFRSLSAALMVCVPMTSTAMLFLLAQPLGYSLNLFHIMSLFLVLGFGMDYTIFVREMRAHQEKTLQAIMLSALTSLLSFGLLAISSIPVVASFGTALLIGNSFNLLGAFVYSSALEPSLRTEKA